MAGLVRVVITPKAQEEDADIFKTEKGADRGPDKVTVDLNKIAKKIKASCQILGNARLSMNNNPIFTIRITGKGAALLDDYLDDLMKNRGKITGLSLQLPTPREHNVDRILDIWVNLGSIGKHDVTRHGQYVTFINDGNPGIDCSTKIGKEEYRNTCTIMVLANPRGIVRCHTPTIANLRKLARKDHFVDSAGDIMPLPKPKSSRRGAANAYKPKISNYDQFDTETDEAVQRARDFMNAINSNADRAHGMET